MSNSLSVNIQRFRKERGMTQKTLAEKLGVTFQTISKWETGQAVPVSMLIPSLAKSLNISVDSLFGYSASGTDPAFYESYYQNDKYFWGVMPSKSCLKVLEFVTPPSSDRNKEVLKLLDIGCGEGKDAVFFARLGFDVTAFDISASGIEKTKRLAEDARVNIRTFVANINEFRLEENFDILFSNGVLHYIKPKLRDEIMANYKAHVNDQGIVALHVFVNKPFIEEPPPAKEEKYYQWKSGQLLTYFHDWYVEEFDEYIFECGSFNIPHRHCANRLFAKRV